ncbi:MAG TPA: hypothetical protein PLD59_03425 [Tepidisphaeraceae bacterium]|nr:hypothetical protein [Tepidisphaeraceae bacterium]
MHTRNHPHHTFLARVALATAAGLVAAQVSLAAFPGAEGFAAGATGGRGGDVYRVTNLEPDPGHVIPGSLFYGLYEKHVPGSGTVPGVGRTIVFDVGGTIHLDEGQTLDIKNIRNVTIAGQTAPTPITIIGDTVQITSSSNKTTSNIVMRHLNIRKGTGNGEDALSIKGSGPTTNILIDHISGSWSEDEVISVTQKASNVSIQYSMMSEALTNSHAYGSLIRPNVDSNVSYSHNFYSNQKSRNPRPGTYDGKTLNFEFNNNVVYNWSDRAGYAGGSSEGNTEYVNMNMMGNYFIAGPSTPAGSKRTTAFTRDASNSPIEIGMHQSGNLIDSTAGATRDGVDTGWGMLANWNGTTTSAWPTNTAQNTDLRRETPFAHSGTAVDSAEDAYARVIASAGAFPWARNAIDQRLINDVLNYTGFAPITAPPAAEWNSLLTQPMVSRPAGWDTDNDGMPNHWEAARGTNPAVADNNVFNANGYTNLENYLNELAAQATWNLNVNGTWSGYINWLGDRPNSNLASATFPAGNTAPLTVSVDMPITAAQLNFNSNMGYALAGVNPITIDVVGGYGAVNVTQGAHMISAPLVLSDATHFNVATASSLLLVGDVSASAVNLTKNGAGQLATKNIRANALNITAGSVVLIPGAAPAASDGTSVVKSLSIAAGSQLDLTNNALVIDYTTVGSLLADTRTRIIAGQITSSTADAAHALGYADNAILNRTSFAGQLVDATSVLVRYTRKGDADLTGTVDLNDFTALAASFGGTGIWHQGDFNYDGQINLDDFTLLAANFGESATGGLPRSSAVPEPAMGVLLLGSVLLRRKK